MQPSRVESRESRGPESNPYPGPLREDDGNPGVSVVVGGVGNIGTHLLPHLARVPGIGCVTIVDRDIFEPKNLDSQDIHRRDVGRPKAVVMARRLRRLNPALRVIAIPDALENVPLGRLRTHVWLTCLDSRAARQVANQIVFRLGVPLWIDAGVEPTGLLARVSTFTPASGGPCLECLWNDDDYRAVEQSYACDGTGATPTNGISCLGALAASLQAIECRKALVRSLPQAPIAQEVVLDTAWHKHFVTPLRRNPRCRFDHQSWPIEPLPLTARSLVHVGALVGAGDIFRLRIEGRVFVRNLVCGGCGHVEAVVLLGRRARPLSLCAHCGQPIPVAGNAMSEELDVSTLPPDLRMRPLRHIGLRSGDVVSVSGASGVRYVELESRGKSSVPTRSYRHGQDL